MAFLVLAHQLAVSTHYSGRRSISLIMGFIIDLQFICLRVALFNCKHVATLMLLPSNCILQPSVFGIASFFLPLIVLFFLFFSHSPFSLRFFVPRLPIFTENLYERYDTGEHRTV